MAAATLNRLSRAGLAAAARTRVPVGARAVRRWATTATTEGQQRASLVPFWVSLPDSKLIEFLPQVLTAHLNEADPAVFDIIEKEKDRQRHFINLIASENFTSQAVLDALGSVMQSTSSPDTAVMDQRTRRLTVSPARRQVLGRLPRSAILRRQRVHRPVGAVMPAAGS
jgi:hypothetical protein